MEIRELGDDGSLQPGVIVSPSKRVTPADPPGGASAGRGSFGQKTIGFWSSCCLNLNNVMGAAIVALPLVNQQAVILTKYRRGFHRKHRNTQKTEKAKNLPLLLE